MVGSSEKSRNGHGTAAPHDGSFLGHEESARIKRRGRRRRQEFSPLGSSEWCPSGNPCIDLLEGGEFGAEQT